MTIAIGMVDSAMSDPHRGARIGEVAEHDAEREQGDERADAAARFGDLERRVREGRSRCLRAAPGCRRAERTASPTCEASNCSGNAI